MDVWRRDDGGQALILAAGGMVLGVFILAVVINSGFGLAQRRTMQNAADAGALAAAQLLATNVSTVSGSPATKFRVSVDYVYCVAKFYADKSTLSAYRPGPSNRDSFRDATRRTETMLVQWSKDITATNPYDAPTGGTLAPPASACPTTTGSNGEELPGPVATGGAVNPDARYIRVESRVLYENLIGVLQPPEGIKCGNGPATRRECASASAVARIAGAQAPMSGPTWPMIRHYNPNDFTCTGPCNPLTMSPTTFWSANGGQSEQDVVFGSYKGLIDLSRFAPNANRDAPSGYSKNCTSTLAPACVPQLMTDYDHRIKTSTDPTFIQYGGNACASGNVTYPTPPAPPDWWLASGGENSQSWDKDCSLQNWAGYRFEGNLSLTTNWSNAPFPQEPPADGQPLRTATSNPPRTACQSIPVGLAAPSCANGSGGDWIEGAVQSGNQGSNISRPLKDYIAAHGVSDGYSGQRYGTGQSAPLFGKKVVMSVYLWDCSETYTNDSAHTQALRNQWSLNLPKTGAADCSAIHQGNDMKSQDNVNRIHLFTVATFTFYEGTVGSNQIQGFWGGWFDPNSPCQLDPSQPTCGLNEFANTAYLVGE